MEMSSCDEQSGLESAVVARLVALCELTGDFIGIAELDGSIVYENRSGRELLKLPLDGDISNFSIHDFLVETEGSSTPKEIVEALLRDGRWEGFNSLRALDGTLVPVWQRVLILHDPEGAAQYVASIGRDQTVVMAARQELLETVAAVQSERVARDRSEFALRESEQRYRGVVEDQTELVCRYLPDTTLTFVNSAFANFYGRSRDDLLGEHLIDIFPIEERAGELARLAAFGPEHHVETQEDWEPRFDGSIRWYQWIDRALLDDDGTVREFQSVGHDIHERRAAERSMRLHAEILEMVAKGRPLDDTLLAIASIAESESPTNDWRCSVMLLNSPTTLAGRAAPSLPAEFGEIIGSIPIAEGAGACGTAAHRRKPVVVTDVTEDPLFAAYRDVVAQFGIASCWSVPLISSTSDEVVGTFAIYGRSIGSPSDEHRRFVDSLARLAEIAIDRKAFEDRLAHESVHDPLTGLPNRALLIDRVNVALARAHRSRDDIAVLFLDLDGFKIINDSLGHSAGDALLIALAERLSTAIRPGDTFARFGGDEFVVLCEDLSRHEGAAAGIEIASRLLAALNEPFSYGGSEFFLRASIGIAIGGVDDDHSADLLRDADAAMYHAKELGKGRWAVFDDAMRDRAVSQHATFNALHRALERGELEVFYQPIIENARRKCVGAEALVRWNHPERGLIGPNEFVPLAEQSDLIVEIGEWVLSQTARYIAAWPQLPVGSFTVSVNLSGRQLTLPDLAERVRLILEREGARPEALCFEITESMLMADTDAAIRGVEALRQLGCKLSIDDFGTGYSSLAYLKRFPVDLVKVDRSFVAGLGENAEDTAIVAAVVSMAHALGLQVVAEGVETEDQFAELGRLGCDFGQGYLFARPMPIRHLTDLLTATRDVNSYAVNTLERSA